MKQLKLSRTKMLLALAIVGTSIAVLAFKPDMHQTSYRNYSGEELFEGIILMDGEFAHQIPMYENILSFNNAHVTSAEKEKIKKLHHQIVEDISKHHPGYFDKFKEQILSGEPVLIDNAIKESAEFLKPSDCNLSTFYLSDFAVIYQGVAIFIETTFGRNDNDKQQLKREQLVEQIVSALI